MSETNRRTTVLLIAHGSRRAEANHDVVLLAEQVRWRSDYALVQPAYLELADPSIPAGGAACVAAGAERVLMLPYFLFAGSHVVEDLERYRGQLAAAHPGVEFTLCPPLGLHPLIVDVVLARLAEGAS